MSSKSNVQSNKSIQQSSGPTPQPSIDDVIEDYKRSLTGIHESIDNAENQLLGGLNICKELRMILKNKMREISNIKPVSTKDEKLPGVPAKKIVELETEKYAPANQQQQQQKKEKK